MTFLVLGRRGHLFKKWSYDSKSSLLAGPSSAQQRVAIATMDGRIILLDYDGNIVWQFNMSGSKAGKVERLFLENSEQSAIYSTPTLYDINNDKQFEVLCGSDSGYIYALNSDGKMLWSFKSNGPVRGKIIFANGKIIFGSMDGFIYILNPNGALFARFDSKSKIESTPAVYLDNIIFGADDGIVRSIDFNCNLLWKFKTNSQVTAEPTIAELYHRQHYVVIGSTDKNLYCLTLDGKLEWIFETEGRIISKAEVKDVNKDGEQEIFFGSCDSKVYALRSNGKMMWSYHTDFWVVSSPIVVDIDGDGNYEVIAGSYDNIIYVLDAEGSYLLDYMPGISGIVMQSGHYTNLLTSDPGELVGKRIWEYKTEGIVTGAALFDNSQVIVTTKPGIVDNIAYSK
jgi:outer membrane protein assembly factor BamB